jgi:hypothetical protein
MKKEFLFISGFHQRNTVEKGFDKAGFLYYNNFLFFREGKANHD